MREIDPDSAGLEQDLPGIQRQVQLRLSESESAFSENPQGIHMHIKVEKHCPEKTHSNLAEAKVLVCKPG